MLSRKRCFFGISYHGTVLLIALRITVTWSRPQANRKCEAPSKRTCARSVSSGFASGASVSLIWEATTWRCDQVPELPFQFCFHEQ